MTIAARQPPRVVALVCALLCAAVVGGCGDDPQGTMRVSFSMDRSLEFSYLALVVRRAGSVPTGAERGSLGELDLTSLPEASCRASDLVGDTWFSTRNGAWTAGFFDVFGLASGGGPDSSVVELFSCTFYSDQLLSISDFEVGVTHAIDLDRAPFETLPVVTVSGVEQIGPLRTTTTEFPPDAPIYDVTAGVISESGLLGALQFDINASSVAGGWVGAGGGVNCSFNVAVGLTKCNDKGAGRLICALVDVSGFDTPASIVTCQFATVAQPSPQDFAIVVRDAAGVNMETVSVEMAITDLQLR